METGEVSEQIDSGENLQEDFSFSLQISLQRTLPILISTNIVNLKSVRSCSLQGRQPEIAAYLMT